MPQVHGTVRDALDHVTSIVEIETGSATLASRCKLGVFTAEHVNRAGVQSQVSIRAGNMLDDDFGSGYDLILLNAICHMFSEGQNRHIFRRARAALAPNGHLAVQDFILNPDKTGPQHAVLFSINMLVGTESGARYSEQEYTNWMNDAGLRDARRINLPGPGDLIVGRVIA
jgi:hypothetical protein